ncbi:MAG: gliding motility-associated C-terminal domain-containing protein, partial [Bacteroidetes bacterium]
SNTDQITITVNTVPSLSVSIAPATTICSGEFVTLTAYGADSYNWDNGIVNGETVSLTATTILNVTGTNSSGCYTIEQITITVNPLPSITAEALPFDTICEGDSVKLTASGANTYVWDNGVVNGNWIAPGVSTTYHVTGTDVNGCSNVAQISVTVIPQPAITEVPSYSICMGQSVKLKISGDNISSVAWSNSETLSDTTELNPIASPDTTTSYTVIAYNGGCSDTSEVLVKVNPLPEVFAGNDTVLTYGQSFVIPAIADGTVFDWSPIDNLSCFDCLRPEASPTETTEYMLWVKDEKGCTNTDSILITVEIRCGDLFIPNVFTPNDDNDNDLVYVYSPCIQEIEFRIYDRWGNNVFTTTDPSIGWDGTYNGKPAQSGVYAYIVKALLINGKETVKQGNITLIR